MRKIFVVDGEVREHGPSYINLRWITVNDLVLGFGCKPKKDCYGKRLPCFGCGSKMDGMALVFGCSSKMDCHVIPQGTRPLNTNLGRHSSQ